MDSKKASSHEKQNTTRVTVDLEQEDYAALLKLKDATGRTAASLIRGFFSYGLMSTNGLSSMFTSDLHVSHIRASHRRVGCVQRISHARYVIDAAGRFTRPGEASTPRPLAPQRAETPPRGNGAPSL